MRLPLAYLLRAAALSFLLCSSGCILPPNPADSQLGTPIQSGSTASSGVMVTNHYPERLRVRLTIAGQYSVYECAPFEQAMVPSPFYLEPGVSAFLFAEWLDASGQVVAIATHEFYPYRDHSSYTWSYSWQPSQEIIR